MTLAPAYRAIRTAQGKTLRQVAAQAEISPGHLSRIERGLVEPGVHALVRICHALEMADLAKRLEPFMGGTDAA